jgi:hypothetical protein
MPLVRKIGTRKQNLGSPDHLNCSRKLYLSRSIMGKSSWSSQGGFPARSKRNALKMAAVYEDNFGFWDIDGQEEDAFFDYVQRQSVKRICDRCDRPVRLMPSKTLCASCVTALECGAPASMSKY